MVRRERRDEAGASFHVMNRGVARRTIFDARSELRFVLACLARAAKRADVEVLAYALMRTQLPPTTPKPRGPQQGDAARPAPTRTPIRSATSM